MVLEPGFDVEALLDALKLSLLWDELPDYVLGALQARDALVILNDTRVSTFEANPGLQRFTIPMRSATGSSTPTKRARRHSDARCYEDPVPRRSPHASRDPGGSLCFLPPDSDRPAPTRAPAISVAWVADGVSACGEVRREPDGYGRATREG